VREYLRALKTLFIVLLRYPVVCGKFFLSRLDLALTKYQVSLDNIHIMKPQGKTNTRLQNAPKAALGLPIRKDGKAPCGPHDPDAAFGSFCAHAQRGNSIMEPQENKKRKARKRKEDGFTEKPKKEPVSEVVREIEWLIDDICQRNDEIRRLTDEVRTLAGGIKQLPDG